MMKMNGDMMKYGAAALGAGAAAAMVVGIAKKNSPKKKMKKLAKVGMNIAKHKILILSSLLSTQRLTAGSEKGWLL